MMASYANPFEDFFVWIVAVLYVSFNLFIFDHLLSL